VRRALDAVVASEAEHELPPVDLTCRDEEDLSVIHRLAIHLTDEAFLPIDDDVGRIECRADRPD
jgi:hypothetical protein